uniref:G-protein coupled receptors family 1 profile domain-containing protein n=1 Tax=Apteryx owenii TaxID=8824 RepID=A0A8B9NV34_APTOW
NCKKINVNLAISGNKNVCFNTGTVLLIFLAVLSYECYCTMMGTTEVDTTNYRKIWMEIVLSWTYSLFWTVPPLFGRNSYGPEGPGTTCSVNWHSKDANNVSYIICLFIFCFVIPFVITVYLYGKLLSYTVGNSLHARLRAARPTPSRILIMVVVMVICFLLCWLPYGLWHSYIIPSILAKSSTVYDPVIYIFLNKQVSKMFSLHLLSFNSLLPLQRPQELSFIWCLNTSSLQWGNSPNHDSSYG